MADTLLMLALSPTMETGTIQKWFFSEGDAIKEGDVLCEVETDKAAMEYESMYSGILLKIIVHEGGSVKVGDPVAVAGKQGEDISEILTKITSRQQAALEKPGQIKQQVGDITPGLSEEPARDHTTGRIKASPLARKMAKEKNINLTSVTGTGPGGRIIKRDIEKYLKTEPPPVVTAGQTKKIPLSEIRKTIARRMAESKFSKPHYYLRISADMTGVINARTRLNNQQKSKISFNAFIMKLTAETLKKHPLINSSLENQVIIQHGQIDIGLAVALEDGLTTPVVRQCGLKSITAIDKELKDLITRTREKKLDPLEYTNATFTISNLGSYGIEEFTGIINPPGSALLTVGAIMKVPVVNDAGEIVISQRMQMTLSCDHRVIDGAVGALFLNDLKQVFENPISAWY